MNTYKEYTLIFKALGDETRLKIVEMLSCGELCACDILEPFHITQPTLSYHMKILTDCGLIRNRKEGSWIKYSLNKELTDLLKEFLDQITSDQETCICKDTKEVGKCE
ncbi:MAG: metalloregulator ArsR/SmtB family transcription factor [Mobilitalea sp.]